jgi:hypothetical protein
MMSFGANHLSKTSRIAVDMARHRLGGELPAFTDKFGPAQRWQRNWLPFSHGRASLAWLLERHGARSAVICAYTCPTVPSFLRRRSLKIGTFDLGASRDDIAALTKSLPSPRLVIMPALFGAAPWLNFKALRSALDPSDMIVVDAAQTAFGHMDFAPAPGIAVLSCPRKTTELADGAVLAVPARFGTNADIAGLSIAEKSSALKSAARALWAAADPNLEKQALDCNRQSEESWPDAPHRMSDLSQVLLTHLDRKWHASIRRRNFRFLAAALKGRFALWKMEKGTPFCLPIFVDDQKTALSHLHEHRIFASALWPDAEFDAARHRSAAWVARHLISLPVDQRHDEKDMRRIAEVVIQVAKPHSQKMPAALELFVQSKRDR